MKKLKSASFLIFLFATIIYSNSEAKVLPIIEGSELLDTLASQNNEVVNMPELTAGIYKHIDFKHMIPYIDKYPLTKKNYNGKWISCHSKIYIPFDSLLYPKPYTYIRFTGQTLSEYYPGNI
jgi:hypothetical protein